MNRKLAIFVVLVFVFLIALFFIQQALNIDFERISLTQFAPTLAYLFTIILFKDLILPIKANVNKAIIVKTLFSIVVPFFLLSITYFFGRMIKLEIEISHDILSVFIKTGIGTIIGAIGEEIGWRSFLQPTLEKKYSVFVSSIIVGLIWGIWHMQHYIHGPIFVFMYLIFTISVSIIIVFLSKDTQYNIIISSIFHASMNMAFNIYFGFIGSDSKKLLTIFSINSIVWLIFAAIIVLLQRDYFSGIKNKM